MSVICVTKLYSRIFVVSCISISLCYSTKHLTKMCEIVPPQSVRGMKKLDREMFKVTLEVPCLKINASSGKPLYNVLNKYVLKLANLPRTKSVTNNGSDCVKEYLLNPQVVSNFSDIAENDRLKLEELGVNQSHFSTHSLQLTYDNWSVHDVFTAVLPKTTENLAGYSMVGHIVHLNLREHLLDYKHLIGQVLLDKIKQARTVVNKVDSIDTTFRVFNMEVLAGDNEFVTEVKENGVRFRFDFSSVYWNPRLCTERERITKKLKSGNIVYDIFAGVGPFSIPAAKKGCTVLANDLNPESFKWLKENARINKVDKLISTYNKDGFEFIREDVKQHMLGCGQKSKSHVIMNLPATSVTFLPAFKHLLSADEMASVKELPLAHVYCFVKGEKDSKELAKELVENELGCSISDDVDEITFVRNVAPNKDMMRVSFQLSENIVLNNKRKFEDISEETNIKKI